MYQSLSRLGWELRIPDILLWSSYTSRLQEDFYKVCFIFCIKCTEGNGETASFLLKLHVNLGPKRS